MGSLTVEPQDEDQEMGSYLRAIYVMITLFAKTNQRNLIFFSSGVYVFFFFLSGDFRFCSCPFEHCVRGSSRVAHLPQFTKQDNHRGCSFSFSSLANMDLLSSFPSAN